jgi:ATP-dependent Clp protease protease subunit
MLEKTMEHGKMELSDLMMQSGEYRLLENRIIFVSEGINASVSKRIVSNLLAMEVAKPGAPITMYLNSPGGEVNSGYAIFDTIRFITSPVNIVASGLCASIATVIFVATEKNRRYSMPNTKFLIHQPLIPGQIYGQASDIEITAKEILKTRQKINDLLSKECKQPLEKVAKDTTRDYWMSASEALEYGLVTKIIENIKELK